MLELELKAMADPGFPFLPLSHEVMSLVWLIKTSIVFLMDEGI